MENKNFEHALPDGYREELHINASDKKLGLILNLIAIAVMFAVIVGSVLIGSIKHESMEIFTKNPLIDVLIIFVAIMAYMVLHELVHGAAYKALTREKLTFGISWSCAFCGVPNILVYRKATLIAVSAPLVVFTLLLGGLGAALYFVSPYAFLINSIVFGMHLGGCSGDIYLIYLLLFRFKDKETLIKDTGPEQFIYVSKTDC